MSILSKLLETQKLKKSSKHISVKIQSKTMMDEDNESPRNEMRKDLFEWKEITNDFFESVNELNLGELLHFEMFGLFEAMSAIEMMDKKMDIGMIDGKDKNIPLTFDVAVQVN